MFICFLPIFPIFPSGVEAGCELAFPIGEGIVYNYFNIYFNIAAGLLSLFLSCIFLVLSPKLNSFIFPVRHWSIMHSFDY